MASNKQRDERVKALVAELLAEEAKEGGDAVTENMNDIEDAMVRIADMVAREVGIQKLAGHAAHVSGCEVFQMWARGRAPGGTNPRPDHSPRRGPPDGNQVSLPEM